MTTPLPDMIVVIPGIMGSTLKDRNGNELWGVKPGTLLQSIFRLGRNFEGLRLPAGIGDAPAPDGVAPGALIPIPHVVGKLLGTDGYGALVDWLEKTFDARPCDQATSLCIILHTPVVNSRSYK